MAGIAGTPSIITSNLALYLDTANKKSYKGSGTAWNDLTTNGSNFTLYNSPTFVNNFGGELQFDGTNDYARNRNTTIINNIAANGTVEIWFRSYDGTLGATNYSRLISISNEVGTGSDTTSTQASSETDFTTYFTFAKNVGSNYYSLWYKNNPAGFGGSTTYVDNIYRQLIFSWSTSGANMTFTHYINSVSQVSTAYAVSAYSGAQTITIGMNSIGAVLNTFQNTKVAYSIVRFYSKTLSQAEITQNFNATRGRFGI